MDENILHRIYFIDGETQFIVIRDFFSPFKSIIAFFDQQIHDLKIGIS